MLLASIINKPKLSVFLSLLTVSLYGSAQQNSPFSRFGLGDVLPASNILNRGMGGLTAAHADAASINFANPASYSRLNNVTFDLGLNIDSRTLKSAEPVLKYNSINFTPSYVLMGIPLSTAEQRRKKNHVAMVLGLRPVTSINYSVVEGRKIQPNNTDSVIYHYEGSGGLNQAIVGLSKKWGNFSIGINTGYTFGRKQIATRTIIADTSFLPTNRSNSSTTTSFGGLYLNGGAMYEGKLSGRTSIRLGVAGNLSQNLNAEQDMTRNTFFYSGAGSMIPIDTVSSQVGTSGQVTLPSSINAGIAFTRKTEHRSGYALEDRMIGIEYTTTNWADYRFMGQNDNLNNSWMVKVGGQLVPRPFTESFWNNVAYRAGFNIGRDHVVAMGKNYSTYSMTVGAGFPLRSWRTSQSTQINTSLEFGKRGSRENNITENFLRFSVGFNLSDIWFIKRRYD
ncbi:hypothetical protein [Aridibaculum aurantiacum]|uniref:hypothetical protein n=1 Tax=Aridibaculum aurantiacum TaxID=2810307 RepID=UPI001A956A61|nr:hypothetical protein [Aridibaculum aurantiacum]